MIALRTVRFVLVGIVLATLVAPVMAADDAAWGDWHYNSDGDVAEAYTRSNTGVLFGLICVRSVDSCLYYLKSRDLCSNGSKIPVLVNAESASNELIGTCEDLGTKTNHFRALVLTPYQSVVGSLGSGQVIGFAVPMVGGEFKVYRFNLDGSAPAIQAANDYASHSSSDQTL